MLRFAWTDEKQEEVYDTARNTPELDDCKKREISCLCSLCGTLLTRETKPKQLNCEHSMCEECAITLPMFNRKVPVTPADEQHKEHVPMKRSWTSLPFLNMFTRNEDDNANDVCQEDDGDDKYGYVLCPVCRSQTSLGQNAIVGLALNNQAIRAANDIIQKMSECADCSTMVTVYCQDCKLFYCENCFGRIHAGAHWRSHRKQDPKSIADPLEAFRQSMCEKHDNPSPLELFCTDCKELTCMKCQFGQHRNHNLLIIDQALTDLSHQVSEKTDLLETQRLQIAGAAGMLKYEVSQVKERLVLSQTMIQTKFEMIVASLREIEKKLIEDLNKQAGEKSEKLEDQREYLECFEKDLDIRCKLTEKILNNPSVETKASAILKQIDVLDKTRQNIPPLKQCVDSSVDVCFGDLSDKFEELAIQYRGCTYPERPKTVQEPVKKVVSKGSSASSSSSSLPAVKKKAESRKKRPVKPKETKEPEQVKKTKRRMEEEEEEVLIPASQSVARNKYAIEEMEEFLKQIEDDTDNTDVEKQFQRIQNNFNKENSKLSKTETIIVDDDDDDADFEFKSFTQPAYAGSYFDINLARNSK